MLAAPAHDNRMAREIRVGRGQVGMVWELAGGQDFAVRHSNCAGRARKLLVHELTTLDARVQIRNQGFMAASSDV